MLVPIAYEADGVRMTGWLADGGDGSRSAAGVLVAHEAPGIGDHVRERARRLAGLGYVGFALDLYGIEAPLPLAEARARNAELMQTPGLMLRRARAALDALAAHPSVDPLRLAAIGFCQGGIVALELARAGASIRAAIGFHPGLMRAAASADGPIAAKVLMMIGDCDPVILESHRTAFAESMREAGADWQLHVFGGVGHSFTNPAVDGLGYAGFAYDAAADRRSWAMALDLLAEAFAGAGRGLPRPAA